LRYFRAKKRSPINSEVEGKKKGCPGEVKALEKGPNQFEGGGEKERVAGGGKGAEKTINSKAP